MQPVENSPEETQARPTPNGSDVDQIAELLAGEANDQAPVTNETETGSEADAKPEAPETAKKELPKDLNGLAETLGIEAKDLYDLEISFDAGDGESVKKTLGQMKDELAAVESFEVDRLAWEEDKRKAEAENLRAKSELNELLSMLPKSAISKELVNKVAARRHELERIEEARTLDAIKSWRDEDTRAKDEAAINDYLVEYGLPDGYLDQVVDHRVRKLLHDAVTRKARVDAALAKVRQLKTATQPPSKPEPIAKQKTKSTRSSTRKSDAQDDQIAALLSGN